MQGYSESSVDASEFLGLHDPTVADVCAVVIEPRPDWRAVLHVRVRAQVSEDFRGDFILFIDMVRRYGISVSSEAEKLYRTLTGAEGLN